MIRFFVESPFEEQMCHILRLFNTFRLKIICAFILQIMGKNRLLEEGKPVCVEIEKYNADLSEYSLVVMIGRLKVVADYVERDTVIEKMVNIAKKRSLSTNFLFAHGPPTEACWDSLSSDKPLIIVKLDNVTQVIGLKSP